MCVQARKERQLHMQMYPGWSARDNYAQSKEVDFITSKVNITPYTQPEDRTAGGSLLVLGNIFQLDVVILPSL